MGWIYLLDSHLAVFYNSPPQFRTFEARFGIPKQDAIFEAVDPTEISCVMPNTAHQAPPLTLHSVVQHLMDDKPAKLEELQLHINTLFAHFLTLCGKLLAVSINCLRFAYAKHLATY